MFDLPILPYGVGCPGLGGFRPRLLLEGTPTGGQTVALSIDDGLGGALSLTIVGAAPAWLPLGGACALLVAAPAVLQVHALGGAGPGNGQLTRTAAVPPNLPIGTVRLQAFVADAASPSGFSSSNGLRVEVQ